MVYPHCEFSCVCRVSLDRQVSFHIFHKKQMVFHSLKLGRGHCCCFHWLTCHCFQSYLSQTFRKNFRFFDSFVDDPYSQLSENKVITTLWTFCKKSMNILLRLSKICMRNFNSFKSNDTNRHQPPWHIWICFHWKYKQTNKGTS